MSIVARCTARVNGEEITVVLDSAASVPVVSRALVKGRDIFKGRRGLCDGFIKSFRFVGELGERFVGSGAVQETGCMFSTEQLCLQYASSSSVDGSNEFELPFRRFHMFCSVLLCAGEGVCRVCYGG